MRCVLVTHNVIRGDGQGRVNYEIVRRSLATGWQVDIVADRVAPELVQSGARWIEVHPWPRRPLLLRVPQYARGAERALRHKDGKADVLIANGFTLRCDHHVNISHMVHAAWQQAGINRQSSGQVLRQFYQRVYSQFNSKWEKQAYRAARSVVAVSNRLREDLIHIGIAPERIRVITNGVDLNEFSPGAVDRSALALPQGVPLLLFVGDIRTPGKNLDTLLRALQSLPDVHLAVVGSKARSPYPRLTVQMQLEQRVHFLDYRLDIPVLMRSCDLFVFPSRYDSFGLVVLEAMASGIPVVTTVAAGASQLVTPECGSVLQDPNDPSALACAIRSLLNDPLRMRRMGIAARAVAEDHSWSQMADKYLQLFREFIS